jgi:hypothetical protein
MSQIQTAAAGVAPTLDEVREPLFVHEVDVFAMRQLGAQAVHVLLLLLFFVRIIPARRGHRRHHVLIGHVF